MAPFRTIRSIWYRTGGFTASNFTIVTGISNEVDLLVLTESSQFWDGNGPANDGIIQGGDGTWEAFGDTTKWTNADGTQNSVWQNNVAVFGAAAGTVTVTQPIFFAGMVFMTDGYQIDAGLEGTLNLIGSPTITTADMDMTTTIATISAPMMGDGGIIKDGPGTLILNGDNTYTGGTTISAGTLQLGNGGTSGSILGDVVDNGTFAINRSDTFTFSGVISGAGAFQQLGTGTTILPPPTPTPERPR